MLLIGNLQLHGGSKVNLGLIKRLTDPPRPVRIFLCTRYTGVANFLGIPTRTPRVVRSTVTHAHRLPQFLRLDMSCGCGRDVATLVGSNFPSKSSAVSSRTIWCSSRPTTRERERILANRVVPLARNVGRERPAPIAYAYGIRALRSPFAHAIAFFALLRVIGLYFTLLYFT